MSSQNKLKPESIFTNYWRTVREGLGLHSVKLNGDPIDGIYKKDAIQLSGGNWQETDGEWFVRACHDSLECDDWKSRRGRNWEWRDPPADVARETGEVALELKISERGGKDWSRQMSTVSGIRTTSVAGGRATSGNATARSIDLVYKRGEKKYIFIELKVSANNPLHAIFELLSYGLSYCHVRASLKQPDEKRPVLAATHINLLVLGPSNWFKYTPSRGAGSCKFEFERLLAMLNAGLARVANGAFVMTIATMDYELDEHQKTVSAAKGIIDLVKNSRLAKNEN